MCEKLSKTKFYSVKTKTLFVCLFVAATFLLSACGEEKYVKGTTKLRCDGVYVLTSNKTQYPDYLRFFAEGGATSCSNIKNLTPEAAYEKMISADGSMHSYGNVYKTANFTISDIISTKADGSTSRAPQLVMEFHMQGGRITYTGNIGDDTLDFEVYSTLNGRRFRASYKFIPISN